MRSRLVIVFLFAFVAVAGSAALQGQTAWKQPPKNVVDILDAPPTPRMIVSPTGKYALLVSYDPYPPLEMLARPFLRLAGLRVDPALPGRQRTVRNTGLEVLDLEAGVRKKVPLPPNASINHMQWAHMNDRFAFTNDTKDGVELWVGEVRPHVEAGGVVGFGDVTAAPLEGIRVNDVLGAPFQWVRGGCEMIVRKACIGRSGPPASPAVPAGPVVEETAGKTSKVATFQDLLKNSHDEDLFEYYATSQLWHVHLNCGEVHGREADGPLGKPGMYAAVEMRPMLGDHLVVTRLERPFSYRVPWNQFAQDVEIWDRAGRLERLIAEQPLADDIPPQGVRTGPRALVWRPMVDPSGTPALVWVEALDGGDPLKKVAHRDRIMALEAPFEQPKELLRIKGRFSGLSWKADGDSFSEKRPPRYEVLVTESDRDRRWTTTSFVDLASPAEARVVFDRSVNDAYGHPGMPVEENLFMYGEGLVRDGDWIFLAGAGASEAGDRPFLDRFNPKTLEKQRLWQSTEGAHESFVHFANKVTLPEDRNARPKVEPRILIRSESRIEPPNWFLVDLTSGERKKLTDYKDPAPELTKVRKELLKYKRADGVQLSGTLYLPPDWKEGTRLPLVVWAYPLEYSDASTAGQVRGSTNTFTRLAGDSPLFFLLDGYAVLMDATMPVIGDSEKMNDTFVEQIVAAAQAAVDKVAAMGIADRDRCCISGHSYGAFMTANLLAHSDIFAAGIARSGAYNRTLTPFGFQSERRSYWEATDVYTRVSPFTYANQIKKPLLMIHGEADNNPGTHAIQSERLFQAIKGNGGTARLVLLPHEAHGYRARESVLHVLAEMFDWADKYVKNRHAP